MKVALYKKININEMLGLKKALLFKEKEMVSEENEKV